MSSSKRKTQGSTFSASSPEARHDAQSHTKQPEPISSAGEHMKHQTDSKDQRVSSHAQSSSMTDQPPKSSTVALKPTPPSHTAAVDESARKNAVDDESRQLPIPPASEPKQYRAIGLIYGKYVPSDEQFTRGNLIAADDLAIDSVLLGRVMSLVKKHIDLEKPHLWVVYPRTRNKDRDLHAQIVGVWEPEKLNRSDDPATPDDAPNPEGSDNAEELDNALDSPEQAGGNGTSQSTAHPAEEVVADVESADAKSPDVEPAQLEEGASTGTELVNPPQGSEPEISDGTRLTAEDAGDAPTTSALATSETGLAEPEGETDSTDSSATTPDLKSSDAELDSDDESDDHTDSDAHRSAPFFVGDNQLLKDGYFSIRGEVVKVSEDPNEITVKIRQAPRKGSTQQRSFNLVLKGHLEGRLVGYFWELNVQREGTDLVVQDGKAVGIVLPKKRDKQKKPFGRGKGGPRGRGGPSGRRQWDNRSGQGDRPDRPDGPRRQPIAKPQKTKSERSQPDPKTN